MTHSLNLDMLTHSEEQIPPVFIQVELGSHYKTTKLVFGFAINVETLTSNPELLILP